MLRLPALVQRSWSASAFLAALGVGLLATAAAAQDEKPEPIGEGPKPVRELQLERLPTWPYPRGGGGANVNFVDTSLAPRDKAPRLEYEDQTADFQLGQTIRGEQSGATAVIAGDSDNGPSGALTLGKVTGSFVDGETISDPSGGSAKVRGTLRSGIWVLDFAFKPVRTRTVEIPGKGRRQIYYLYYRVTNHTGQPRNFIPEFTLVVPESGRRYSDSVLPNAVDVVKLIETREDPSIPLLGAVSVVGSVPPSTKEGVDDAVFGVAMWEVNDDIARADRFDIYVRGLSDGYKRVPNPDGETSKVVYKALKLRFDRPGDERQLSNREIRLLDPPYEWTYW